MLKSSPKPFMTLDQQVINLSEDKGLKVSDADYAKSKLGELSYFALIGGYKHQFYNPAVRKYLRGVKFEEVVALYDFDKKLRELFLKYIFNIERKMRTLLSYHFTVVHGEKQAAYLDSANYDLVLNNADVVYSLINILRKASESRDYAYINYQRTNYNNIPLWVLVNVLTFGNISYLYQCFPQNIRMNVSKNFNTTNESELRKYLKVLTKFRNVCAHNERLFSYKTNDSIPDTKLHIELSISKKGSVYKQGKRDLFSLVIIFRYLLSDEEFIVFKEELISVIEKFINKDTHISKVQLLDTMGFPINWENNRS